jgi:hypothetical protein
VIIPGVVIEAGRVGIEQCCHGWGSWRLLWRYWGKRYGSNNAARASFQLASSGAQISPPVKCVG